MIKNVYYRDFTYILPFVLPLAPGIINISLVLERNGQIIDQIEDVFIGLVDSGGNLDDLEIQRRGSRIKLPHESSGLFFIETEWTIEEDT